MERFLEIMAEVLEVEKDTISLDSEFSKIKDDFSSLVGFAMIVALEENFNVEMTVQEFLECRTLGDIYNKITK